MYTINFEPAAFIVALLCLVYCLCTNGRQYRPRRGFKSKMLNQHFVFILLLVIIILSAGCSAASTRLPNLSGPAVPGLMFLSNQLYFLLHACLPICMTLYFMNYNGSALSWKRRFFVFFILPFAATELIILSNPFTHWAFSMDGEVYRRGPLMYLLYVLALIYVVMGFYFFFRYKRAIRRSDSLAIVSSVLLVVFGVLMQALRPDLLVEQFFEAMGMLGILVMLEDRTGAIDPVTRVNNREAFLNTNRRLMETKQRYRIILLHLPDLAHISRLFYSRDVDLLLEDIAAWLETLVPLEEVFRLDQDGFALVCADERDKSAEDLAQQLLDRFGESWTSQEVAVRIEAMVEVIRVPEDVSALTQLQDLIIGVFQDTAPSSLLVTGEKIREQKRVLAVEDALRSALEENRLEIWYQPIWSAETKTIVAAEALARLTDPQLGSISPEEFIPIAERTGLIHALGLRAFREVCRMLGQHRLRERGLEYIEVNLSLYQFLRGDLLPDFEKARREWGLEANQINLEITESVSSDETPAVRESLQLMREAGYTFSLDDFGTGYSNVTRLLEGGYNNVKIDKSILWSAEENEATARLLEALTRFIRSLGMNVIQEGVETGVQLDRVLAAGGNLIQGWYFSKSLPEAEFLDYLDRMNGKA
jgi:EAL domain-containing protein (putative c-di-GMP-specific phosphodiesterase class I)/GGDEF domain-containing protein